MGGAAESVDLTRVLWSTHTTTTQETKTGEKIQLDPGMYNRRLDDLVGTIIPLQHPSGTRSNVYKKQCG